MQMTPAIKGQLTKAVNEWRKNSSVGGEHLYRSLRTVFARHMPAEQAKHATKKYLLVNFS
jgi:hypothetical protein